MIENVARNLENYMTLLSTRQKLTASNIANADTPGYLTRDIDFAAELRHAARGQQPQIIEVSGLYMKNDGNNVSMDREARSLAENALRFTIASHLVRGQMNSLRMAMEEGRS